VYWLLLVATVQARSLAGLPSPEGDLSGSPEAIRALAQSVADDRAAALRSENFEVHACVASRLATMLTMAQVAEAAQREDDVALGRRKIALAVGRARVLAAEALGCPDPPPPRPRPVGWVEAGGAWEVPERGAALLSGGVAWRSFESDFEAAWTPGRGWGRLAATLSVTRGVALGLAVDGGGRDRWVWAPVVRGVLGGGDWRVTLDGGVQWASDRDALRPAGGVVGEGRLGPVKLLGGATLNRGWWLTEASTLSLEGGLRLRVLPPAEVCAEVALPLDLDAQKPGPVVIGAGVRWRF